MARTTTGDAAKKPTSAPSQNTGTQASFPLRGDGTARGFAACIGVDPTVCASARSSFEGNKPAPQPTHTLLETSQRSPHRGQASRDTGYSNRLT
jgi:hypothetical protein